MPKLLLRYALSKLELLEEEALDLQNLDFALGRNTTLEFKDVGVRLKVRCSPPLAIYRHPPTTLSTETRAHARPPAILQTRKGKGPETRHHHSYGLLH